MILISHWSIGNLITLFSAVYLIYRVFFFTGPTQKSSKYGTGPPQYKKMTKFIKDSNISTKKSESVLSRANQVNTAEVGAHPTYRVFFLLVQPRKVLSMKLVPPNTKKND